MNCKCCNLTKELQYPVLDGVLAEELKSGSYIAFQDDLWHIFAASGDGIASGKTISEMLFNLIMLND